MLLALYFPISPVNAGQKKHVNSNILNRSIFAGGYYSCDENERYPLLAVSHDGGENWNYTINKESPLPKGYYTSFYGINSISCNQKICVASGSYTADDGIEYPFLAVSHDKGDSFLYKVEKDNHLPLDFKKDGFFYSTSCNQQVCVAVGDYRDDERYYPMMAVSRDNGLSWHYMIQKNTHLPEYFKSAEGFHSVHCSKTSCVAVGQYVQNGFRSITPLIAVSTDGGLTFDYQYRTTESLPHPTCHSELSNIRCKGNMCSVAGSECYNVADRNALIAISRDSGLNWNYQSFNSTNTIDLPKDYVSGSFADIDCTGSQCMALGNYYDTSHNLYFMLAQSHDGGNHWRFEVEKGKNLPYGYHPVSGNQTVKSVSCSGKTCVFVGNYATKPNILDPVYPLLGVSTDAGLSLNYIFKPNGNLPKDYYHEGILREVNCTGKTCVAVGSYGATRVFPLYPLLVISNDGGKTWDYKIQKDTHLPSDFLSGEFWTISQK